MTKNELRQMIQEAVKEQLSRKAAPLPTWGVHSTPEKSPWGIKEPSEWYPEDDGFEDSDSEPFPWEQEVYDKHNASSLDEQVSQPVTDEASRKLHTAAARINDEARETGERSRKLAKQLNNLLQGLTTPLGGIRQVAMDSKSNFAVFMQNGTKYSIAELLDAVKKDDTEW